MRWCKQKFPAWAVLLGGALVLAAAVALPPGADGWGKDGRWRLPPCSFKLMTGWLLGRPLPCATCGFTHAFSYAAHGRIADALREQPAGALAFFVMLGGMGWAVRAVARRESPSPRVGRKRWRWWIVGISLAMLLAAWAYKLEQALR